MSGIDAGQKGNGTGGSGTEGDGTGGSGTDASPGGTSDGVAGDGRVVVVGGGLGGLVAARRLVLDGNDVTLLEASDRLGGSIAHHRVGGIDLDAGAESFAMRGGVVAALATDLGLGDQIVFPSEAAGWIHPAEGTPFALPAIGLNGIPGVPLASDVTTVIGAAAATRAFIGDALLPGLVGARSQNLAELVRRRMGSGVLDKLVSPVIYGSRGISPAEVTPDELSPGLLAALRREGSLARAVRDLRLRSLETQQTAGIRVGLFRLVEELTADLDRYGVDVRLNSAVTSTTQFGAMVGTRAVPGTVLNFVPEGPTTPFTLVTLVLDAAELDASPRGSGVLVGRGAPGIRARSLAHRTAKWPWLAERARGKHVVRLSYDGTLDDPVATAIADAHTLMGIAPQNSSVVDAVATEWARPVGSAGASVTATVERALERATAHSAGNNQ